MIEMVFLSTIITLLVAFPTIVRDPRPAGRCDATRRFRFEESYRQTVKQPVALRDP